MWRKAGVVMHFLLKQIGGEIASGTVVGRVGITRSHCPAVWATAYFTSVYVEALSLITLREI
jgi:hypothetical protein